MNGAPIEIQVLAVSVALVLLQIGLQSLTMTAEMGVGYNVSARDGGARLHGVYAPRLERALKNLLETYTVFVALALALAVTGKSGGAGTTGALVWIVARGVYLPLYAFGVPVLRTLVWIASIAGLVMMLTRLVG